MGHVTLPAPHAPRSPDAKYVYQVEAKVPRIWTTSNSLRGPNHQSTYEYQKKKKKTSLAVA